MIVPHSGSGKTVRFAHEANRIPPVQRIQALLGRCRPHVLLSAACLFWAGNVIAGRALGVEGPDHIPPASLNGLRWAIALLVLAPATIPKLSANRTVIGAHWRQLVVLGVLGIAGYYLLFYYAVQTVPALEAGLLVGLMPVVILGLTIVAGAQRPTGRRLLGLAIAVVGSAAILLSRPTEIASIGHFGGDILVIVAVFCWSLYTVLLQRWRIALPPTVLLSVVATVGLLATLPAILWETAAPTTPWHVSQLAALAILYVGIFPAVGSTLCWNMAVREIGAGASGVYLTLIPIFSTVLAILLLGEPPRILDFMCLVIVVSGVFLACAMPTKATASGPPE